MRFLFFIILSIFFHLPAFAACTDPEGVPGELMYNGTYDVFQGCTERGWAAFHAPSANPVPTGPQGCPNIGDTCTGADAGMIYAGTYAGHKLYVTAADAPGTYTWNDGSANRPDLDDGSMPNCPVSGSAHNGNRWSDQSIPACIGAQGPAFTAYLANFTGSGSPYEAASYCYHLGKPSDPAGANNPLAHGRDDWYLPAVDELEFIYDHLGPQPNHGFQNVAYWSSTEDAGAAWLQFFDDGTQARGNKVYSHIRVRCVSR